MSLRTLDVNLSCQIISGAVIGSLLPDIDHGVSVVGSFIPLHLIKHKKKGKWVKTFKHGGATHTLVAFLLMSAIWLVIGGEFLKGVILGFLSHLYIDDVTGRNLKYLFYPFKRRKG